MQRSLYIALIILFMASSAHSMTVTCTNCSDRFVQAMERVTNVDQLATAMDQYGEAVTQTEQQIRMVQQNIEQYTNMLQNTKNLMPETLAQLQGEYKRMADLYKDLNLQRGDMDQLQKIFKDNYGGFDTMKDQTPQEYQQKWETWSKETDRAMEATFQLSGSQLQDLQENADDFDSKVQQLLTTPQGRMEAAQAANQLAAYQLRESRELRTLMNTYIQGQVQQAAKQEQIDKAAREQDLRLMNTGGLEKLTKDSAKKEPAF